MVRPLKKKYSDKIIFKNNFTVVVGNCRSSNNRCSTGGTRGFANLTTTFI